MENMYCEKCGQSFEKGTMFCPQCKKILEPRRSKEEIKELEERRTLLDSVKMTGPNTFRSLIDLKYDAYKKFFDLIGINKDNIPKFKIGGDDSTYVSPNGKYIMVLRYSKSYADTGHYWFTLEPFKDQVRSRKDGSVADVYYVFCCHADIDTPCDQFVVTPVTIFMNVDMDTFRPHFFGNGASIRLVNKKLGIRENLGEYLNVYNRFVET